MKFFEGVAWFLILILRGLLLWFLLPISGVAWVTIHIWAQHASFEQTRSWYDLNLTATLASGLFRFMISASHRPSFISIGQMNQLIPHRISLVDFA
ncbi:hypothetical protein [Microbacterium sp. NPDC090003]|uniref:hypothetical protein n=1 Tax=Microbacterium sp. NPDC090003 TaxID=3364203 RepID=UPI0037F46006